MSALAAPTSLGLGVYRVAVPTPFLVGDTNVYLLDDDPLTLVDAGPAWVPSLRALERGLGLLGHRVEDLELILVTHQHMDHVGLVETLVDRSGALVACLDLLVPFVRCFGAGARRDDDLMLALMRRHGVPEDAVAALVPFMAVKRSFGSSFVVDRALSQGEVIELRDRRLRVLHRPGHSPSDTIFHDESHDVAFGGDHLLANVSSNAVISASLSDGVVTTGVLARERSLVTYLDSLTATRALGLREIFAGHGPTVTAHRRLIDERVGHHRERAARIRALIREEPLSAHQIAVRLWGREATPQAHLTLSEVLGHVDLLIAAGEVDEQLVDERVVFVARS